MKRLCTTIILLFITLQAHAGSCYKARIIYPDVFMGNNNEMIQLFDGSTWVIRYAYENLALQYPMATMCPKTHTLIVDRIKFYVDPGY